MGRGEGDVPFVHFCEDLRKFDFCVYFIHTRKAVRICNLGGAENR